MNKPKYPVSVMRLFFVTGKYNQLLGVPNNASIEVIERAYKNLAKEFHPDVKNPSLTPEEQKEMFQNINTAKTALIQGKNYVVMPKEKIEKSEYAIRYLLAKNANIKQQLHRIQQNDLQRMLELQMDLERRESIFGRLEHGLYKVWIWIKGKDKSSHRRLILLSASVLSAILAGVYFWDKKRRAFVRVNPSGFLTYTKKVRRR